MQLFESVIYHLASSIPPARQDELALVLNNNGATSAASVADATHIITNSLRFEGWADATAENVVIDKWVDKSLIFGKLQPAQFYSPDPSMIFSGVVACAAELSAADLEVLSAGITALGGQWRIGLTKDVTHLFAISPNSNKYATAMHFQQHTRVIVLLPHWFDDSVRLGMRGLDTAPYAWPDPVMMRGPEASNALEKGKSVNRVILRSTTSQEQIGPVKDVWGERRILLSASLELSPGRREAVQAGIERAKGVVVDLGDAEDEAEAIERCDVLVTRFRSGAAYLRAVRSKKTVGTLAWVWHVQSTGVLTRPVDQLLHYPIPRRPVEGFEGHEITVTNYTGESREYLKKLITTMGATFTPSMSGKNTVLIAAYISGIKTTKAASWSIPIVNHTWLEDCFVRWRSLTVALEKYIVFPPGVDFGAGLGGRGVGRVEDESDLMEIEAEDAAEEAAITGAGTQESGKEAQEVEAVEEAGEITAAEVDHLENGDEGEAEDEPATRPRSPQKQRDRGPERKTGKRPEKDSSSSSDVEVLGSPSAVPKTRRKQPSAPPPPASLSSSLPEPEAEVVVKKLASSAKKASNGVSPAKSGSSKLGVRKRAAAAPSDSDSDSDAIVVEKRGRVGKSSPKKAAASPAKSHKSAASPKPARKRAAEISSDSDSEVVSPVRAKNGTARGGKAGASPTKTYISASKTSARAKRARAVEDDDELSEEIDAETPEVEEEEKRPRGAKQKSNEHKAGGSAKRRSNEGAGRGAADLFESASGDEEVKVRRASGSSSRAGMSRKAVVGRSSPVKTKGRTARAATEEDEEEEDEDPRPKSVKTKSTPRKQPPMSKSPAKTKGKVARAATEEEEEGEEEDGEEDDDEIPKSKSAKTKSTPRKQPPTSKNKKRDTSETDTDSDATPPSLPMHTQRKRVSNEGGATKTKTGKSTERPASSASKKPTPKKPVPKERSPSPAPKRRLPATLVSSPSKKQFRAADAMDVDSTEGDSDSIPPPPKRPPRSSAASASHTARSRATKGPGVVRVESPMTSTTEPAVPSPAPEEMQISARGPSMRGAAAKATQKLRDEIMPDLVNYQNEMKKGRKSVGGGGSGAGVGGEAASSSARRKRAEEAVEKEKGNGRETKRRKVESDEENAKKGKGKAKAKAKAESDEEDKDVKKGKGKAKTKAKAGSESESESEPVQITKSKGKATTAPLSKSSGLDQSTTKKEVKLMTTQVTLSDEVIKALGKLGVRMTTRPSECTHLIVPHLVRTEKFLCALAVVPHILTEQWALKSAAAKKLLPEDGFVLKDKVNEKKYDFSLAESLERAKQLGGKLFDKQTFYITPRVPIETKLLKNVVTACGGQITTQTPSARILSASPNRHIISCADDVTIWRPIAQIHPVYSHELLLTAALKQEIEWDNEKFKVSGSF